MGMFKADESKPNLHHRLKALRQAVSESGKGTVWLNVASVSLNLVLVLFLIFYLPVMVDRLQGQANQPRNQAFNNAKQDIEVGDLINAVQSNLAAAEKKRQGKDIAPLFQVKKLEIKLHFISTNSTLTGATAAPKLLTINQQAQDGHDIGQELTIDLDAKPDTGGQSHAGGRLATPKKQIGPTPPLKGTTK